MMSLGVLISASEVSVGNMEPMFVDGFMRPDSASHSEPTTTRTRLHVERGALWANGVHARFPEASAEL